MSSRKTQTSQTTHPHKNTKSQRARRRKRKKIWTIILMILLCLELAAGVAGGLLIHSYLADLPDLQVEDLLSQESSRIFDKDGNQIADVGTQLRENITYDELSESVIDCFLAAEDSRYFEHDGLDLPRFVKAILVNVKNVITGNPARQGGSTFTMQLIKVTYFQDDTTGTSATKDLKYKVQQIALARELETRSNKKAIFEMYLNKLNFGGTGNIRGIEMASQYYYGKSASELNLPEAAMLAGVINSPYRYDPHNFLEAAQNRRDTVLNLMYQHGYITKAECELAKSVNVEDTLIDPSDSTAGGTAYAYQSYIDTAIKEAEELTGQDPYTVAMDIYTCMDPAIQQVMDDIQAGNYEEVVFPDDLMEVAMVSENNQTGEIVAIGGGRNYGRGGAMLLNHATDQYKQPGSSVKPFLSYALAFEYLGWATSHTVTDKPIVYEGTDMVVTNATNTYAGQVSLEYAVGNSLNTPAIQTLQEVIDTAGWQTVVNYIMSLGFSQISEDNFDIGFAIGGSNFTCSAVELAAAHAVLMNGGYYIEPHTIRRIEYRSGLSEPLEPTYEKISVLSEEAAYLSAYLMYQAVNGPYHNYMQILQRDYAVYGKTGTTDWGTEGLQYNIPQGAAKDKWMISETTQYTTAVWVGYEKGIKDADTYFDSTKLALNIPGHISNIILSALSDSSQPAALTQPDGVVSITHIVATFPYAAPIDGMDSSLLRTGLIKSDKATLVDLASDPLEVLQSFEASFTDDGQLSMTWTAYPDADKLTVADSTMDISLYDSSGNLLVSATGTRLFDTSWVFGPVRYKARVSQNGVEVGVLVSDTETSTQSIELTPNTQTEVCGYYAYENDAQASNEVCTVLTSPAASTFSITPSDTSESGLQSWCQENSISFEERTADDSHPAGTYVFVLRLTDGTEQQLTAGTEIDLDQVQSLVVYYYK